MRELKLLKYKLSDKYVAGFIIAKLPPAWRSFATFLKHKRHEISVEQLIASLDVEGKAQAKDTTEKVADFPSNTNMVQRNFHGNGKNKGKKSAVVNGNKPAQTTTFKKKKKVNKGEMNCFTCGEFGHFSRDCPDRANRRGKKGQKAVNIVTSSNTDTYSILPTVLTVFQSPCW